MYGEPWHEHLTDKEIKKCEGDYIGCEICRNKNRCNQIKLEELEAAMKDCKKERKEN